MPPPPRERWIIPSHNRHILTDVRLLPKSNSPTDTDCSNLCETRDRKATVPTVRRTSRETAMGKGTKLDLFKYLVARIVAFVGLTTISTVVMAIPYISSN